MGRVVYKTMMTILNDEKDTILIEVPDLGILTQGFGMADAMYMARDAIGTYYLGEDRFVEPGSNTEYTSEFEGEGERIEVYVDIDIAEYKSRYEKKMIRKNVTIPSWLNYKAEQEHINVSRVLQEALMEKLGC